MNYQSEKDDHVTKHQRGNCSNEESPSSVCSQLSSNMHKDITDKIDVYRVATEFVELNERRKNYFGTY